MNLKVICVNNLTYAMTGGQTASTTPGQVISATAPYGVFEPSFNLVALAETSGASYVARWTTYHVKQLARSMNEVLNKKGFCFIEVLSPCPDALPAPQQDGRRPGRHEVLQAGQQNPQWRADD
jgi:2-oxoglutarate ferredoxin oxidoreductase subunit beta